jgi:predicted O-methyltransferase YrrM
LQGAFYAEALMENKNVLSLDQAVEWRAPIWGPAIQSTLDQAATLLPAGSKILELGFNSGVMSCYLAQKYGWNIEGHELQESQQLLAVENARLYSVSELTQFNVTSAEKTFDIEGPFDGIFLKSFLYHNKSKDSYKQWIEWLYSRLRPGGVLMAIENCRGHFLDRFYREKLRRVSWSENTLFDAELEGHFKEIFKEVEFKYFGGVSQYLTGVAPLSRAFQTMERASGFNRVGTSFLVSIISKKPY